MIRAGEHNQNRKNALGNVFNRLGKAADMKETLNRRMKQECPQHSLTQRVCSEINSLCIKNIPLDKL